MKKIFLSQPMNGLSDDEIFANRKKAIDEFIIPMGIEFEILESFFDDYDPEAEGIGHPGVAFLGKSLQLLAEADLAVFLPGYELARGCRIEQTVAVEYGIETMYIPEWN